MYGVSLRITEGRSETEICDMLNNLALPNPETVLAVDWKMVQHIPAFTLPEAVALSLNINPEYAYLPWVEQFFVLLEKRSDKNAAHRKELLSSLKKQGASKSLQIELHTDDQINNKIKLFAEIRQKLFQFTKLLHIAKNNLTPLGVIKLVDGSQAEINLAAFGAWAKQNGWELPTEFPCRKAGNVNEEDKVLGTKERKTLLKMIIGMAIKGYSYDPAAKRSDKVPEICADLEAAGVAVSDDTIRTYLKEASDLLPSKPFNDE